ncbi:hypothetical protein FC52_GL001077 [Lactobacillus pasteurii DSM 23907 = CRBIP 24.76]|uniref:Prophage DNA packaging protein NU1 n=1 Tax=Lactobacillus pasteurii DSM 23907 = CRBIP 24.76 TaxID=1423790 RepID=I7LBR6_9LACO|nr:helix-turn-helix domain-containing protein [Lactobacillus pasteurii]KRK07182.1 hypothetical protein FC52_GL001077 [Lactobacillus pasteurii DSM 23907 = CRBIP 24.76]TDG76435.1 hypothetical protein C5L33_001194 [Lactobacillus pasteurii]CCI85473.1 Prophage DNA packaging protein NU1 [Lactobacillus pasteurii DSM 23907 = CRBIP 24.76]CCI85841.1 Prophage DNA packaging protein NU1 [Lactobacillus pasteurii DSM 23907 = CRBIP 24.76]
MLFQLDKNEETELKKYVLTIVKDAIKSGIENNKPYLTRKEVAKFLGVAESTVTNWVSLGMPVAIIDGRKLYGKQSILEWLKSHEVSSKQ